MDLMIQRTFVVNQNGIVEIKYEMKSIIEMPPTPPTSQQIQVQRIRAMLTAAGLR